MDNFNIRKFLTENKLTIASRQLTEEQMPQVDKQDAVDIKKAAVEMDKAEPELSSEEQKVLDDILGGMKEGIGLDDLDPRIADKIRKYGKKGLLTLAIVATLMTVLSRTPESSKIMSRSELQSISQVKSFGERWDDADGNTYIKCIGGRMDGYIMNVDNDNGFHIVAELGSGTATSITGDKYEQVINDMAGIVDLN